MDLKLNTDNWEYITWQYEQLNFGLLGGLRIEGLERMRVTLKVEYKQQAVRHNLDLYNNESVDKLVRRCSERFTLGTAYLACNLHELYTIKRSHIRMDGKAKDCRLNGFPA